MNVTVSPVSFRVVVVVLKYSVAVLYPVEGVLGSTGKPRGAVGGVRAEDGGARVPALEATTVFEDVVEMLSGRLRVSAARSRSREAVERRNRR